MKKCSKCGEIKPLDEFHKNKTKKHGLEGQCKACTLARGGDYRAKSREKVRVRHRKYRTEHRELCVARMARYRAEHPERVSARNAEYRANNAERCRGLTKQWLADNPEKVRVFSARRRAAKLQATPAWADHSKINAIYAWAKHLEELGVTCHVDHIVPLRGKMVCGLHVHDNLRVVIDAENVSKGAKLLDPFEPCEFDMPGFRQWLASRSCT